MTDAFHWDQCFITGLTEVDDQHHYLVNLINQFGELLAENHIDLEALDSLFKELVDYSKYHFFEEENMMRQIGIDNRHMTRHINVHQRFIQEINELNTHTSTQSLATAKEFLALLSHWLAYHILGIDQDMARQIKKIQSGISAGEAYLSEDHATNNATQPLLDALTGLFQDISAKNKTLAELNQSLEAKVEERTKALAQANLLLEALSLTDVLTSLPNRRSAFRQFALLWDESSNNHTPLVCMMIDADHFKEVNDTFGHQAGDHVLSVLARTLQNSIRTDDLVSRLGGDEFLVICPNTDTTGAQIVAGTLLDNVRALQAATGDGVWQGSVSIGVAIRNQKMSQFEDLIKSADACVYAAKKAGKNCMRLA